MALKRHAGKEMIFVALEYFEKLGVSRQVIEYHRALKRIRPVMKTKGILLYYKLDADLLVLRYWMNSFRRFINEFEKTKKLREEARKQALDVQAKKELSKGRERERVSYKQLALESRSSHGASSTIFTDLIELIRQYRLPDAVMEQKEIGPYDPRVYISDEIDEFLNRICAYLGSGLDLDEYLKREKPVSAKSTDYNDVLVYFYKRTGKPINSDIAAALRQGLIESL